MSQKEGCECMTSEEYQKEMTEMLFENAYEKEYLNNLKKEVEELTGIAYETNDYIGMVEDLLSVIYKRDEIIQEIEQDRDDNFRRLTPDEMGWR